MFVVFVERNRRATSWWETVAERPEAAPGIVRELLRSTSVVADLPEAHAALAGARALLEWSDAEPALVISTTARLG